MAPRSRDPATRAGVRAMTTPRPIALAALVLAAIFAAAAAQSAADAESAASASAAPPRTPPPGADERFTEELLLRPLPSGHLLALFHFESSAPARRAHHARFPRAAAQLLTAAPAARRVELSLAAGRWRALSWGAAPFEAKPGGAELRAAFDVRAAVEQYYLHDEEDLGDGGGGGRGGNTTEDAASAAEAAGAASSAAAPVAAPALRRAWDSLAHGLSGLLCASLNFVARPEATAREVDLLDALFGQEGGGGGGEDEGGGDDGGDDADQQQRRQQERPVVWMRASLPREAVCTENLTPWLKLLPCRDGAGLAALLRARPAVFAAEYHALSVSLRREGEDGEEGADNGGGGGGRIVLAQRLALVLRPLAAPQGGAPAARLPPAPGRWAPWSLAATLAVGEGAAAALGGGSCPQASLSRVYVQQPPEEEQQGGAGSLDSMVLSPPPHGEVPRAFRAAAAAVGVAAAAERARGGAGAGPSQRRPAAAAARISWYDTDALAAAGAGDVSLAWRPEAAPASPPALQPRWGARAYTTGANMARGTLVLELERAALAAGAGAGAGAGAAASAAGASAPAANAADNDDDDDVVCASLVVPWFVRVWVHTLELSLDGRRASLDTRTAARRVVPASARASPLALDLCLRVPRSARLCRLSAAFSTGFMTVFEFPPDAHRGVDVPAARVTWLEEEEEEEEEEEQAGFAAVAAALAASPLLAELARPRESAAYSDGVLVALAPPDFSMPYNVVCLTSTALAVYVGASINGLLRRRRRRARKGGRGIGRRKRGADGVDGGGGGGGKDDEVDDDGGGGSSNSSSESGSSTGSGDEEEEEGDEAAAARAARAARRRARKRQRVLRAAAFGGVFVVLALWIDPELRASCAAYLPDEWRPRNATEEARAAMAGVLA